MKEYITAVKLPDAKIGTPLLWVATCNAYYLHGNLNANSYTQEEVENNPEFFKEVKDSLDEIVDNTYAEMEYCTSIAMEKHKLKEGFTRHLHNTLEEIRKEIENRYNFMGINEQCGANICISIIKSYIK